MIVFLSETRRFDNNVDGPVHYFGLQNGIGVGSFGRGGGLALLWSHEVKIKVQSCDKLHIDVAVLDPDTDEEAWRFTGFYGEPQREMRHRSWDLLKLLNTRANLPWLCVAILTRCLRRMSSLGVRADRSSNGGLSGCCG